MWLKLGVPWQWSPEQYAEKLKIGGGKERMASLFQEQEFRKVFAVPESEEERKALVTRWHKEKTAIYQQIISSGAIQPRSGIKRLAEAALSAGWKLAVASTSAKPSVEAVLIHAVGETDRKAISRCWPATSSPQKSLPRIFTCWQSRNWKSPRQIASPSKIPETAFCPPILPAFRFW